ncbi:Similar to hypothetical protein VITISV_026757 [Vitis vinifera]; acc. no. CAN65952 [Pyronema omphalodes CBS 100304]|uniref:Uncharacterized protein n=1 Tax=Pyronema omphalodes (strain CBS 100304) TaxID=1076935 RepID=U4L7D9_PYROM|nr:Similar to hypothetical protein VITISV_026757 [Vitis vinifera]; acc. no. CAN65952 [Pyronema omphalodes CBS 100304]
MLIDAQAPTEFWAEAVNTAVYIHQRIPSEGLSRKLDFTDTSVTTHSDNTICTGYHKIAVCFVIL